MPSRRREQNLLAPMGANTGEMGTEVRAEGLSVRWPSYLYSL